LKTVLFPTFIFLGVGALLFFGITTLDINQNLLTLIILNTFSIFFVIVLAYFLLLDKHQRASVYQLIKKIRNKVKSEIL